MSNPPTPVRASSRRDGVAVALLAGSLLFGVQSFGRYAQEAVGIDFYQFWVVGLGAKRLGVSDPWSEEARRTLGPRVVGTTRLTPRLQTAAQARPVLETYSTPFLYTVAGAVATGNYDFDLLVWQWASMGVLLLGLAAVLWLARPGLAATLLVLVFVLTWHDAVYSDARLGNVGRLQCGALGVLAAWLAAGPPALRSPGAGILLGLMLAFKPNFLFVPVFLLLSGLATRRRAFSAHLLMGLAAGGVVAGALSSWFFGSTACWWRWLSAASALPDAIITLALGNYSLGRWVSSLTGWPLGLPLGVGLPLVAGVLFVREAARHPAPPSGAGGTTDALAVGLGAVVGLLSSRLVWLHYFLLALPMALLALRSGAAPLTRGLGTAALIALAAWPASGLVANQGPAAQVLLLNAGAACLLLAGLREVRVGPAPGRASGPA